MSNMWEKIDDDNNDNSKRSGSKNKIYPDNDFKNKVNDEEFDNKSNNLDLIKISSWFISFNDTLLLFLQIY